MKKTLFVLLASVVMTETAFSQEKADSISGVGQYVPAAPEAFATSTYGVMSQYEMPEFMQKDFSGKVDAVSRRLEKQPEVPDFKFDESWTHVRLTPRTTLDAHNPYAYDYDRGGVVTSWKGGALTASGSGVTMPGMMSWRSASFTAVQHLGNFTFRAGVSASNYLLIRDTKTLFGIDGSLTYSFNDNVSVTLFGSYYPGTSFYTMGAMPYFGTSGYGGYFTLMGETLGVDLGVRRYYDSFARRWVTSPIVTPKIKFSEKFVLDLPVGELLKSAMDTYVFGKRGKQGPIIMPSGMPSVAPIPFGTPEMPRKYRSIAR